MPRCKPDLVEQALRMTGEEFDALSLERRRAIVAALRDRVAESMRRRMVVGTEGADLYTGEAETSDVVLFAGDAAMPAITSIGEDRAESVVWSEEAVAKAWPKP